MALQQSQTVALDARHSATLNAAKHVVVRWGFHHVEMRMADLIVLHQALDEWQISAESTPAVPLCAVTLWLNDFPFHFSITEFGTFCNLVADLHAMLPHQVVRWPDLNVRIDPYRIGEQNGLSQFSRN